MNPIDKSFKANPDPLIGKNSPFSIDRTLSSGPVSYLRDKNYNLVGFTYKGKHVFLGNIQKDKSGALFPTAQYKLTVQDIDKLMNMYFTYLDISGKDNFFETKKPEFFKNGKHIFAQVKDETGKVLHKSGGKNQDIYGYDVGKTFKFKQLRPFVDLQEYKPKAEYTRMGSPDSLDILLDLEMEKALEEARAKEATKKPRIKNKALVLEEPKPKKGKQKYIYNDTMQSPTYFEETKAMPEVETRKPRIKNKKLDLEKSKPKKEGKQKSISSDKMDALTFDALLDLGEAKAMAEVETREPRIKNKKLDLEKSKPKKESKQRSISNGAYSTTSFKGDIAMPEVETDKPRIKSKKLDLEEPKSTVKTKKFRIRNKINVGSDTEELIPKNKSGNKKSEKKNKS